jgi:hypothetical protein
MEKTGVLGENHRPVTSHLQTLSHNVTSIDYTSPEMDSNSNYHTITTTTTPSICIFLTRRLNRRKMTSYLRHSFITSSVFKCKIKQTERWMKRSTRLKKIANFCIKSTQAYICHIEQSSRNRLIIWRNGMLYQRRRWGTYAWIKQNLKSENNNSP